MTTSPGAPSWRAHLEATLPLFVKLNEAAEICRVAECTVRDWIRDGRLLAVRTGPTGGGRVLIPRDALIALLAGEAA